MEYCLQCSPTEGKLKAVCGIRHSNAQTRESNVMYKNDKRKQMITVITATTAVMGSGVHTSACNNDKNNFIYNT
jgi:hypothetical protein